jgi:hypothetical protein
MPPRYVIERESEGANVDPAPDHPPEPHSQSQSPLALIGVVVGLSLLLGILQVFLFLESVESTRLINPTDLL